MSCENQRTKKQRDDLLASVQLLCGVYWGPSEELVRQMADGSFLEPFNAVTAFSGIDADTELLELSSLLDGFSGPQSLLAYLEEGYVRLFINDRGGVAAPLYASCYEDDKNPQLMGAPAIRMQKRLTDLKIHISDEFREPPDHLAIELEVLYFLLTRETKPGHPALLTAAADFVAREMLPWVQVFQRHLAGEGRCRFYPLITSILLSVLRSIGALSYPETRPPRP
jgi:TorA-specific chaperone